MKKHDHAFKYPWPNFRRCTVCGLRQFFWACSQRWRKGLPTEVISRFGAGVRPELVVGQWAKDQRTRAEKYYTMYPTNAWWLRKYDRNLDRVVEFEKPAENAGQTEFFAPLD